MIAEYASGASPSSPQKEYVHAGGTLPIAEIDSGSAVKYYEADTLSVRQVTNSSGSVLEDQGQYPYGESWYQSSTQTEFQFTNYLHDSESDNDYAYAREYVNRLARFETLDPADGSVSDPLSWDRYTYVEDDPVNRSDLTGLQPQPPPAPGGINPGGLNTCTLDGVYVSCGFAQQEYTQGSVGKCLNGGCWEWTVAGGDVYEEYHIVVSVQPSITCSVNIPTCSVTGASFRENRVPGPGRDSFLVDKGLSRSFGLPQPSAEDLQVQALANAVVAKAGYLTDWQFWAEWTGLTTGGAVAGVGAPEVGSSLAEIQPAATEFTRELFLSPPAWQFASDFMQGYVPGVVPATLGGMAGATAGGIQRDWADIRKGTRVLFEGLTQWIPY